MKLKRLLATLLVAIMLLGIMPISAEDSSVTGIYVDDIEVIGYYNGDWKSVEIEGEVNPNAWFEYDCFPLEITLLYEDGKTFVCHPHDAEFLTGLPFSVETNQSILNQFEEGETYVVTAYLGDFSYNYSVTVNENPVVSVEAEDLSVIEGTRGVYCDAEVDGVLIKDAWFDYWTETDITVTLKDGTVLNSSEDNIYDYFDGKAPAFTTEKYGSYEEPWVAGGVYACTVDCFGVKDTYNISIVSSPIESIEIEDVTVIENTAGYFNDEGEFIYYVEPQSVILNFTDGSVQELEFYEISEIYGYECTINNPQENGENLLTEQEYTIDITIAGVKGSYKFYIEPSPVAQVIIEDCELIENYHGHIDTYYDENGNPVEYFYYDIFPEYVTVIFKNGDEDGGDWNYINEKYGDSISIQTNQNYNNVWTVGNTYTANIGILGYITDVDISIVSTPIKSAEIKPIESIVNTSGYMDGYINESGEWVENGWFRYHTGPQEISVEFKNGDTFEGMAYEFEELYGPIRVEDNQRFGNEYGIGTYTIEYNCLGYEGSYEFRVVASPVESFVVENFSIIVGTNCRPMNEYDDEGNYIGTYTYYDVYPREYTVTLTNGEVYTEEDAEYISNELGGIYLKEGQSYYNQYTEGNAYDIYAVLCGVTSKYQVTIEESPVESVVIDDIVLTEYVDGNWEEDITEEGNSAYYFRYKVPYIENITVNFKDGTQFVGDDMQFYEEFGAFLDLVLEQSVDSPLKAGVEYNTFLYVLGTAIPVSVYIEESPIERVTLKTPPEDTSYIIDEIVNYKGAAFLVEYKDGTEETIKVYGDANYSSGFYTYSNIMRKPVEIALATARFSEEGYKYAVAYILNSKVNIPVKVTEAKCTDIELNTAENKAVEITFTYKGGKKSVETLKGIEYIDIFDSSEGFIMSTWITTDKGTYYSELIIDDDGNVFIWYDGCISEKIDSEWLRVYLHYSIFGAACDYLDALEYFDGTVSESNIDAVLSMAYLYSSVFNEIEEGTVEVSAEEAEAAVLQLFGVEIDITEFSCCNNGVVTINAYSNGFCPVYSELEFVNNKWYLTAQFGYDDPGFIVLDENYTILYISRGFNIADIEITINTLPYKTKYAIGEELDTEGLSLLVTSKYCNGYVFYEGFEVEGYNPNKAGNQTIQLDINENLTFDVYVGSLSGWQKAGEYWYYYKNGEVVMNKWVSSGGKWYYMGESGRMVTDQWREDSKGWCYLLSSGEMATNRWIQDSKGWCYAGSDGYCLTNTWKKDSNGWCYLDKNGRMVYDKWVKDSKGWCYVGEDGYMVTNKWVEDSQGWCFIGKDGYCLTNTWKKDSTGWCYLDKNGRMVISDWVKDGGKWYYLNENGYMVTGTVVIDGKTEKFNSSGVWLG